MHSNFKAISKVDMNHFASSSLYKNIGGMPVAKAQNMANHAVHRE
jgi:hypothetical protein